MGEAARINAQVWSDIYSAGLGDLRYPNDVLVRLAGRLFDRHRERRVLDLGCGTGANLLHFAALGFEVVGVDVAEQAIARTRSRAEAAGLRPQLHWVRAGDRLPFDDGVFDAAYAWQVLYYSDGDGWRASVAELERVCRPGALILIATAAPGDLSQSQAVELGDYMYRSAVPGQEGCILTIPDREALPRFFPGQNLEIGEFGFSYGGTVTRHWIISFRTKS
jgi:SAM-dependent methyltransferase